MTSPCTNCTRGCCRHYTVTVTGYDAWVIANGLRLAPEQFLAVVRPREPGSRAFALDASPARFDIALAKAPARTKDKPCVFWLSMPGGIGRCGIYALRPFVCQTYPATLGENGAARRREDVLCADDAWRDGVLDHPFWRERVLRMYVEFDIYTLFVESWNAAMAQLPDGHRVPAQVYFASMLDFYGRLEQLRATSADEWLAMCEYWAPRYTQGLSPFRQALPELQPWAELHRSIALAAQQSIAALHLPAAVSS
jgi:Fe-S-cluster containining protein